MSSSSRFAGDRNGIPVWIRHPFVVPFAVAMLFVSLVFGVSVVSTRRASASTKSAGESIVRINREAAARALVRQTEEYKRAAKTLASDAPVISSLQTGDSESLKRASDELSTLARSQNAPAVFLSDLRGYVVAEFPRQVSVEQIDFSYRDWFRGASQSDKPYVSQGYRSAATGAPLVVAIAAPVFDGDRRLGYVVILWQLESLRSISQEAREGDGVRIEVTDQSGQSLLSALSVDKRGQPIEQKVSRTTAQALAGKTVSTESDGRLFEIAPVPELGWTVAAELPARIATVPMREFYHRQMINIGIALSIIALLAMLAGLFARRMSGEFERSRSERRKLRVSDERFRRVFDEGLAGKILVDTDGTILRVNTTMARLLGADGADLLGRDATSCFADEDDQERIRAAIEEGTTGLNCEMAIRGVSGKLLWGLVALAWISEGDDQTVLLIQVEDITARRAAEQRLSDLALLDELTGLPNRRLLVERLERAFAVARSGREGNSSVAALFIDLDGFKKVNDWVGHDVGDKLLASVATDFQAILRPTDTIARIGGDEFVVLIEHDEGLGHLKMIADRIIEVARRQIEAEGMTLSVSASIGIARVDLVEEPDVDADQLIRRADAAMYRAKDRGRDRYDIFDRSLRASTESRQVLEIAVREGLKFDRIALVFQPVVDIDRSEVVGAEALLRLTDGMGRMLPTLPSIVAAESAGLAEAVGDRILDLALSEAAVWPAHLTIAVNISARELTGHNLRIRVESALSRHGVDPSRLILEITETSILRAGPSALAELELLRTAGVQIAIDDFGTGYATLQNLITLPVDVLKVDMSFTAGLPDLRTHSAIVHGIASVARELDIPCVIEGVENEQQLKAITGMGVQAQGWFLAESRGPGHVPEMFSHLAH